MPNRQPRRQVVSLRGRLALWFALAASPGCQRFPIRALELGDGTQPRSTISGALTPVGGALAQVPESSLPPLPPTAVEPVPAPASKPKQPASDEPAPLLDDAVSRASAPAQPLPGTDAQGLVMIEPEPSGKEAAAAGPGQESSDDRGATDRVELPDKEGPEEGPSPVRPPTPVALSGLRPEGPGALPPSGLEPAVHESLFSAASGPSKNAWREGIARLKELARRRAGAPGPEPDQWAVRARLLDYLSGEPDPDADDEHAWHAVLAALTSATAPETIDDSLLSLRLDEAVEALEAFTPLRVSELQLCRKVRGFGNTVPLSTDALRPGQPVLLYCEVAGLRYEPTDGAYRSRLRARVDLLDADGRTVLWSQSLGTAEDLCRKRRRDYYVNYAFNLPRTLGPGPYRLRVTQTDLLGRREAAAEEGIALLGASAPSPSGR